MAQKNQLTTADYLQYSEFERLLDRLHDDKEYYWEMYARLSFSTACRASDVLHFRWIDILDKSHAIVTEQKTKKTREIRINPSVQKKFQELYNLLGCPDKKDYVVATVGKKDKPMTIQHINRKLKEFKYKYAIKIDHFSTHTFRKTFGRYVYESQGRSAESLILLNKIFKHTSIQITKTYIGITKDEVDSIFDSISF